MTLIKMAAALALVMPAAALAQGKGASQPVSLELVSTATIDAPATKMSFNISFTEHGKTQAAADKAKDAKYAEVLDILKKEGVPSSALGEPSQADALKMMTTDTVTTDEADSDDADKAAKPAEEDYSASEMKTLTLASGGQLTAIKEALEASDVTVGEVTTDIDEPGMIAAKRQAKAKALHLARDDAEAYAKEMGLHVQRIARISEAGNNMVLPGLQGKFEQAMAKGPKGMMAMFDSKPGTIKVDATIIVEFVLAQ